MYFKGMDHKIVKLVVVAPDGTVFIETLVDNSDQTDLYREIYDDVMWELLEEARLKEVKKQFLTLCADVLELE